VSMFPGGYSQSPNEFVISTEAQRSGEICGLLVLTHPLKPIIFWLERHD
jgi:hypothetical protein